MEHPPPQKNNQKRYFFSKAYGTLALNSMVWSGNLPFPYKIPTIFYSKLMESDL